MALAPIKVVLKSTTTQTLSDRFTEMVRNKSPGKTQRNREDNVSLARASAKNRRLAEQMSRRKGGHAMMDQIEKTNNVRDRVDQSKVKSNNVRDRLGLPKRRGGGGDIQNRLGSVRGRSNSSRGTYVPRGSRGRAGFGGRGNVRGRSRGSLRSASSRGMNTQSTPTRTSRGTGRGRGRGRPRGRPRGRGRPIVDRSNLDSEIESYMAASKS